MFLPFVAAFYFSFLFLTINATIAESLMSEFGLGADDLGLLTSIYFLTFAAAQIPIGVLLDRYGPRLIQSAVLVAAAAGAALFAISDNFVLLLIGRALVGHGVAAALTARLKAIVLGSASFDSNRGASSDPRKPTLAWDENTRTVEFRRCLCPCASTRPINRWSTERRHVPFRFF